MKKILFSVFLFLSFITLFAGVKENILNVFEKSGIPKEVIVIAISALPIFELRLGLPVAVELFDIPLPEAFLLSFIGNILPVLPILLFLKWIYLILGRIKVTEKAVSKFKEKTEARSKKIGKYEMLGLILFIGIPLPGTGAWTGSAVAVALGMDVKKAFISNIIGVILAGAIVSAFTLFGVWGAFAAGLILFSIAVMSILRPKA